MGFVSIGARNARYYLRYSLGSGIAVAVCFMSLAMFRLYMNDVKGLIALVWQRRFMYADVIVDKPDGKLSSADQQAVEAFLAEKKGTVVTAARFLVGDGMAVSGKRTTVFVGKGYDVAAGAEIRGDVWAWDATYGKPLQMVKPDGVVMLGRRLAERLGCERLPTEDRLSASGYPARERAFRCSSPQIDLRATAAGGIVQSKAVAVTGLLDGVFRELDSRLAMMPLATMQKLLNTDAVSYYAIQLAPGNDARGFAKLAQAALTSPDRKLAAQAWRDHRDADLFVRSEEILDVYASFIGAIVFAIAALAVFATAVKLVTERAREIGTLRAIGFAPSRIIAAFAVEASLTTGCGLLLGVVATRVVSLAVNALEIPYQVGGLTEPILFRIGNEPHIYAITALLLGAISVATTMIVAQRKTAADVADNLGAL